MVEIPDAWWLVLNALLEGPVAWQSPAEVATALERDAEETTDLICLMHVAGWIDVWECEAGPLVTFSPLAAARLQVHLVEVGVEESPRWARVGDPPPPLPRARNVCKAELAAALDYVIDPRPSPASPPSEPRTCRDPLRHGTTIESGTPGSMTCPGRPC